MQSTKRGRWSHRRSGKLQTHCDLWLQARRIDAARLADAVLIIPAQTMARDQAEPTSFLPTGSLFEASMFLFFEFLVMRLKDRLGETAESMRARHINLE
jgi:D-arabinose 5-phosphate isomerase GutQ